jgi:60 kDa SS-A/Ro ribonucleoprotein
MKNAYTTVSTKNTPQSQPVMGREKEMIKNEAGGYVFQTDDWKRLQRFLVLGSDGGTYYVSEQKLTKDNADVVLRCLKADGTRTVIAINDVSVAGRAIKNDPALFALAMCASMGDEKTKKLAFEVLPAVARIPTHLFHFVQYVEQFRGWGRGLRKAVANWYTSKPVDDLAYQLVKYQSRDGWSNADLIRLSHPKSDGMYSNLFKWSLEKEVSEYPRYVEGFENIKKATTEKDVVNLIAQYNLPRECVPTQWLNSKLVWEYLLKTMPITAMVRNLGKMTSIELVASLSDAASHVVAKLHDESAIKKSKIHPMSLLVALKTYSQGHGEKGSLKWTPVASVVNALDEAFYESFANVEPTNKKILLSVDSSGSMTAAISGQPLSCWEAGVAMALITARTEPNHMITFFDTQIREVPISPRERLDDVMGKFRMGGGTDCSLPMAFALGKSLKVDAIVQYTDNETWAGGVHVFQHMNNYRKALNPEALYVDVAMVANDSTLHDPKDTKSMEVVGFDPNVPVVINAFLKGEL